MDEEQHSTPVDETRLAAWRAFLTAHATAIGAIERTMTQEGLIPLAWYDILVPLSEAPERRLRLHELADRVVLSRSGLTRMVDRLERADLLRREPCPDDRRGAFAVLTDAGEAELRRAWPTYARGIASAFARHLTDAEARSLTTALGRVRDAAHDGKATGVRRAERSNGER